VPALLALIFGLSGAAALVFEALWFRQASLALGSSVWASAIVLASFMAGIALGNGLAARFGARVPRPLRVYAVAEVVVAVGGVGVTYGLPQLGSLLSPLFGAFADEAALLQSSRLAIAFATLMLPATAMGLTLPLLTRALAPRLSSFGVSLGLLYGFNTIGAALGAFAAEAWLIGQFGIRGTAWLAGTMALTAGAIAAASDRASEAVSEPASPEASVPDLRPVRGLLAAAFLCGCALLGLEVLWVRFLSLFVPSSGLIFATMLSVVLLGIALGSLLATLWLHTRRPPGPALPSAAWIAGALTLAGYVFFDSRAEIERWLAWDLALPPNLGVSVLMALRTSFPVALISGGIFTLQGAVLHERLGGDASRAAGLLTLANTLGAIVGAAGTGLVALPVLGIERSLVLAAGLYALAGAAMWQRTPLQSGAFVAGATSAALLLGGIVLFPFGALSERFLPVALGSSYQRAGESLVALREARDGTLRLLRNDFLEEPLYYRLLTNGMSMTGNDWHSRRYMDMFVTLPVALHPAPKRALLIGYGIGSTAHALTRGSVFEEIVIVDPSERTLELAALVFGERADDPQRDPRVELRIEDGRFFLQTTDQRFDLITGEPPPPKAPGVVNLYTQEHFELMKARLRDGGIASYWLPAASLTEADGAAILAAFLAVFPDMTLWYGWNFDLIMLGTKTPAGSPVSADEFRRQWTDPETAAALHSIGLEHPEQLLASFLADAPFLAQELADVLPLTDDAPHRLSPEMVEIADARAALALWLDEARALEIFESSQWIAAHVPAELREAPRDAFLDQQMQRWAVTRGSKRASPETLDEVIAVSELAGPVSWLLQSDDDRQRIALRHASATGAAHHLGAAALAERRYADAALHFERAEQDAEDAAGARLYRAYALCLAESTQDFQRLFEASVRRPDFETTDWAWLQERCGGR
jgi:spermidine synthase